MFTSARRARTLPLRARNGLDEGTAPKRLDGAIAKCDSLNFTWSQAIPSHHAP
ncbi:hypothetical protein BN1263140067 [Stenotrophomonas thermophila]|nr:hypothetical protein BN1263140067 [Stenotrophomonas maltophilia]